MRLTTKSVVGVTMRGGAVALGVGACATDVPTGSVNQTAATGEPMVTRTAYTRGPTGPNIGGEHNHAMRFARERLLALRSAPNRRDRWNMCKDVIRVTQAYLKTTRYADDPNAALGIRIGLEDGACQGAVEHRVLDAISPRPTANAGGLSAFAWLQSSQPSISPYAQSLVDSMKLAPVETFAKFHARTTQLANRAAALPEVEREYVGTMSVVADSSYRYWVDDWFKWFPGDRPPCVPTATRPCQALAAFMFQVVGPGMTPQQKENVRTVLKGDVMGGAAGFLRMIPGMAVPGVGWGAVGTSVLWSAVTGSATAAVGIVTFGGGGGGGARPTPTCPVDMVIDVNTGGCRTMTYSK